MRKPTKITLQPRILDVQIIDKDGRRCGKVDDLEVSGKVGGKMVITAIVVGPRAWYSRRQNLIHKILSKVFHDNKETVIPWENVAKISPLITLNNSAKELGLGRIDDNLSRYLEKIPGG